MVTYAKYAPTMVARVAGRPMPRASISLMPNPALLLFTEVEGAADVAVGVDTLEVPFAAKEAAASVLEEDSNGKE